MLTVGTNSYIDVAGASEYFAGRLHTDAWDSASDGQREKALIQATRQIDRLPLKGVKASSTQALAFPRYLYPVYPPDSSPYVDGQPLDFPYNQYYQDAAVPQAVLDAVCEQALFLLSLSDYDRHRARQHVLGVVSSELGDAKEASTEALVKTNRASTVLCPEVRELLRHWLAGAAVIA